MILRLKRGVTSVQIEELKLKIAGLGCDPSLTCVDGEPLIVFANGKTPPEAVDMLRKSAGVGKILSINSRYPLASRQFKAEDSVVRIGDKKLGGGNFQTIAGPCAVESLEQMRKVARDLVSAGVGIIRGGAYKPRTSPYDFQGLGIEGLSILSIIKGEFNLAIVTEVVADCDLKKVVGVADMLQIGSRNCQNYHLLKAAAQTGKPVLLKRGMGATVEEWLAAAEYLTANGCMQVVLCERGIRSFETSTRNTLDISAIPFAKQRTHLPVIVDPSHAAGSKELVLPLAKAAIAAGADGLLIEVHPEPSLARCDSDQQIASKEFAGMMEELTPFIRLARGNTA